MSAEASVATTPMAALIATQEDFLGFLQRRVGNREVARDILQSAYLSGLESEGTLRDETKIVPWFYRILRNAVTDHYRHAAAQRRALERFSAEHSGDDRFEPALETQICTCVLRLVGALPAEVGELVRRVELGEESIPAVAQGLQITPNNARVRLFRARRRLRRALLDACGVCAQHGCLDCNCESSRRSGSVGAC